MVKKLKVGFFSFTCCEGCVVNFIEILNSKFFEWKDRVDIVNFRALRKVRSVREMDVAFVEGAVSTGSEVRKLKEIRKNAKKVVALGSGAINGWPSNLRNSFTGKKKKKVDELKDKMGQLPKVLSVKDVVKVDDEVPGCPIDEKIFIEKMEGLING